MTNRADCCAEREVNLRVGVTDNAPAQGQFIEPDSYTLCGEIPGNLKRICFDVILTVLIDIFNSNSPVLSVCPANRNRPYLLPTSGPQAPGAIATFGCPPGVSGRYVIVQIRTENFLHICEVEIDGYSTTANTDVGYELTSTVEFTSFGIINFNHEWIIDGEVRFMLGRGSMLNWCCFLFESNGCSTTANTDDGCQLARAVDVT